MSSSPNQLSSSSNNSGNNNDPGLSPAETSNSNNPGEQVVSEASAAVLHNLRMSHKARGGGAGSECGSSGGGGNNSDNSALVSLGNASFGFNFDSDERFSCSRNSSSNDGGSNASNSNNEDNDSNNEGEDSDNNNNKEEKKRQAVTTEPPLKKKKKKHDHSSSSKPASSVTVCSTSNSAGACAGQQQTSSQSSGEEQQERILPHVQQQHQPRHQLRSEVSSLTASSSTNSNTGSNSMSSSAHATTSAGAASAAAMRRRMDSNNNKSSNSPPPSSSNSTTADFAASSAEAAANDAANAMESIAQQAYHHHHDHPNDSSPGKRKSPETGDNNNAANDDDDDDSGGDGGYNTDDERKAAPGPAHKKKTAGLTTSHSANNNSPQQQQAQQQQQPPSKKKKRTSSAKQQEVVKREERNQREKERSFRISKQITELRDLLATGGVAVPKGTKSSVLTEAANYIRLLQQHQYRSEIDRHQLVQQMQLIGGGAHGPQAAQAVRHFAAQNGVWSLGEFGGVPPKSAMTPFYQQPPQPQVATSATTPLAATAAQADAASNVLQQNKIDPAEYRFIFNSCGAGIAIASMGGAFIDCNQLFCQLSNYSKQEVCALTVFNLTARQDLQLAFDQISQLISPPIGEEAASLSQSNSSMIQLTSTSQDESSLPTTTNKNAVKPIVLRGAMKNRNDLGMSISLVRGENGIAKCFCVTLVRNPASPFDLQRPVPVSYEAVLHPLSNSNTATTAGGKKDDRDADMVAFTSG